MEKNQKLPVPGELEAADPKKSLRKTALRSLEASLTSRVPDDTLEVAKLPYGPRASGRRLKSSRSATYVPVASNLKLSL
jgi:hypothetical protein